jgi:hypothetical protein
MRHVLWLASAAAAALLTGCAVYPAPPMAGPPPGIVYGAPAPVAVAPAPYPYGYPYEYAYGGPAYYAPPVFFSGSIGYVYHGGGHGGGHGWRPGYRAGGAPRGGGSGGLHLIPRQLRH